MDDKNAKGTGKITGLADISPDETDGSVAVNKNYVDERFADINSGQPFEYYKKGDEAKVVRGRDGKLYKEDELKDFTYDKVEQKYKSKDPAQQKDPTPVSEKDVVVKVMPKSQAISIGNVASGLNVEDKVKDAVITKDDATTLVAKTLLKTTGKDLEKATNLADLQTLAVAGLNFKGNDGEEIHKNILRGIRNSWSRIQ